MNQLNTNDPEAAGRFYSDLFGWEVRRVDDGGQPFWGVYNDGTMNAGMMEQPGPPHWLVYFAVESLEDTLRKIGEGGGETVLEPLELDYGRIAVARDPQGAHFALWHGELDP